MVALCAKKKMTLAGSRMAPISVIFFFAYGEEMHKKSID